jgi:hypothetical protein
MSTLRAFRLCLEAFAVSAFFALILLALAVAS